MTSSSAVSLREITEKTLEPILRLQVRESQREMVASNAVSIAEAHFSKVAWFRGVYHGDTPVGFVMLVDDEEKHEYHVWRFMIDAAFQARGYGRQAMEQVIEYVRTRPGATELLLSFVPIAGNPSPFYRSFGFEETGNEEEGELEMRLTL